MSIGGILSAGGNDGETSLIIRLRYVVSQGISGPYLSALFYNTIVSYFISSTSHFHLLAFSLSFLV
jgi:hypothetical protein